MVVERRICQRHLGKWVMEWIISGVTEYNKALSGAIRWRLGYQVDNVRWIYSSELKIEQFVGWIHCVFKAIEDL